MSGQPLHHQDDGKDGVNRTSRLAIGVGSIIALIGLLGYAIAIASVFEQVQKFLGVDPKQLTNLPNLCMPPMITGLSLMFGHSRVQPVLDLLERLAKK